MVELEKWGIKTISPDETEITLTDATELRFIDRNQGRCEICHFNSKPCLPIPCSYTSHSPRTDERKGCFIPK